MNKLFTKLDSYIDYNNHYSLNRALTTLSKEFDVAASTQNVVHARVVIDAVRKLYDKLSQMYRESEDYGETMSYAQRLMARKIRKFMSILIQKMRADFGVSHETEIEPEMAL